MTNKLRLDGIKMPRIRSIKGGIRRFVEMLQQIRAIKRFSLWKSWPTGRRGRIVINESQTGRNVNSGPVNAQSGSVQAIYGQGIGD